MELGIAITALNAIFMVITFIWNYKGRIGKEASDNTALTAALTTLEKAFAKLEYNVQESMLKYTADHDELIILKEKVQRLESNK